MCHKNNFNHVNCQGNGLGLTLALAPFPLLNGGQMKKNLIIFQYVAAIFISLLFLERHAWLTGMTARYSPALEQSEWVQANIELVFFVSTMLYHHLPLFIMAYIFGYVSARYLQLGMRMLFGTLFSLPLIMTLAPYINHNSLIWYLDLARLLFIAAGFCLSIRYGAKKRMD